MPLQLLQTLVNVDVFSHIFKLRIAFAYRGRLGVRHRFATACPWHAVQDSPNRQPGSQHQLLQVESLAQSHMSWIWGVYIVRMWNIHFMIFSFRLQITLPCFIIYFQNKNFMMVFQDKPRLNSNECVVASSFHSSNSFGVLWLSDTC